MRTSAVRVEASSDRRDRGDAALATPHRRARAPARSPARRRPTSESRVSLTSAIAHSVRRSPTTSSRSFVGADELAERRRDLDDPAVDRRGDREARIDLARSPPGPGSRLAHPEQQQAALGRRLVGARDLAGPARRCGAPPRAAAPRRARCPARDRGALAPARGARSASSSAGPAAAATARLRRYVALRLAELRALDDQQRLALRDRLAGAHAELDHAPHHGRSHARHGPLREGQVTRCGDRARSGAPRATGSTSIP